ncbi:hypothetical protein CsSME_00037737 [Camellia sinensis var. sinensis]
MVAKKDPMLAFNLSKGLYLPANMEHYDHLTKLKAIWLAAKSMVLAVQKSHVVHKRVLELRKTALLAITDADAKVAELKEVKAKLTELATENERLAELVNATETDKQKAVAEKKDRYLRELAKLEKRKNTEVQELKRRWRTPRTMVSKKGSAAKLSHGPDSKVFLNPPPHFISTYMTEYTDVVQKKFLQKEEDIPNPADAPPSNTDLGCSTILSARMEVPSQTEPPLTGGGDITDLTQDGKASEVRGDLDTELEDLFV